MKITKEMEAYIRWQRTDIGSDSVLAQFNKSLINDFNKIKPYLPAQCSRILDIGCGMGGIDLLLSRHYGKPEIHLLDYNGISARIYYGYEDEGAIYNNLDLTKQFLMLNGVDKKVLALHDAGKYEFPTRKCDVIISLLSWGFHYPLETYLEQVRKIKSGILIMDIRHGTDQMNILEQEFNVTIIEETTTKNRVMMV